MRTLSILILSLLLISCQKEEEKVVENYSGNVFSYQEVEGEDVSMSEAIFQNGQPLADVQVKLVRYLYGYVGGSCCWSTRTGSSTLCTAVTDDDGYFECTLSKDVNEVAASHDDFRNSKLIKVNDDNRYVLLYNTTKVAINVIDTLQKIEDGIDISFRAGHASVTYSGANFLYNEGEIINGIRYSTDTISVMENVNMNLSIKREGGRSTSERFFTGDKSNPQTLTIYM